MADANVELSPEVRELLDWDRALGRQIAQLSHDDRRATVRLAVDELVTRRTVRTEPHVADIRDFELPVRAGTVRLRAYRFDETSHALFVPRDSTNLSHG